MGGKIIRLKRILGEDGRTVITPMDHGVSCGPISGLEDMKLALERAMRGGADTVILHKGNFGILSSVPAPYPGLVLHLSASTQLGLDFHKKVIVGSVEEAIRMGADGVSVHINLGNENEHAMLEDLGAISDECNLWQVPLLVMVYVRGLNVSQPVSDKSIAHAVRVAWELGADIIKTAPPKDPDVLNRLASCCPTPIVIAGGGKVKDVHKFLNKVAGWIGAGARGVAIGRNVFQDRHPVSFLKAVCSIVHENLDGDESYQKYLELVDQQ